MSNLYRIAFTFWLFTFFSCSQKEQFPLKKSEKMNLDNLSVGSSILQINEVLLVDSAVNFNKTNDLHELIQFKNWYEEKNTGFDLDKLEKSWKKFREERGSFNVSEVKNWVEITGFLLEVTANEIYAEELETIAYRRFSGFSESDVSELENLLTPFIYTKNVDHIYVNLFVNSNVKYDHTLKGAVEITQETDYPKSGKIQIKFKMENKRFIELKIRIPEWAEGTAVIEKGVKYVAIPGKYCLISRKWKEGDLVEISIPSEKIPKSLTVN